MPELCERGIRLKRKGRGDLPNRINAGIINEKITKGRDTEMGKHLHGKSPEPRNRSCQRGFGGDLGTSQKSLFVDVARGGGEKKGSIPFVAGERGR